MLAAFGVAAGLGHARLAEQIRSFRENRAFLLRAVRCLRSEQLDINGFPLPLLTSPAQEKVVITILGDSIDMAGDATDGRFLSQRPEAGEQYTTRR